jgi:hypothetical protein
MSATYAVLAIVSIVVIYLSIKSRREGEYGLSDMMKGVLSQIARKLQIIIQRRSSSGENDWRPSFIAVSSSSMVRLAPFDLLRWISHHYGFGTLSFYKR